MAYLPGLSQVFSFVVIQRDRGWWDATQKYTAFLDEVQLKRHAKGQEREAGNEELAPGLPGIPPAFP